MGNPDLSPARPGAEDPRGLVIFPAQPRPNVRRQSWGGEWWLVAAALAVAGLMIAIAFAVR